MKTLPLNWLKYMSSSEDIQNIVHYYHPNYRLMCNNINVY